jgi:hypothetical protein
MRIILLTFTIVFWGSCVIAPHFEPQTMEGANCKHQCSENMQLCHGSSYTCDRAYAKCIEACMDKERIIKQQQ